MKAIEISTTEEAADSLNLRFDSREMRSLASNLDVSRKRGDTKRQTAGRIAEQAPAMTAQLIEADQEANIDASGFREARELDEEYCSIDEAVTRAQSDKLETRLRDIEHELPVGYEAQVKFDSEIVSVTKHKTADIPLLLDDYVQAIFSKRGAPRSLTVCDKDYTDKYTPGQAFDRFCGRLERLYSRD